jgi:hypothetical protein
MNVGAKKKPVLNVIRSGTAVGGDMGRIERGQYVGTSYGTATL